MSSSDAPRTHEKLVEYVTELAKSTAETMKKQKKEVMVEES